MLEDVYQYLNRFIPLSRDEFELVRKELLMRQLVPKQRLLDKGQTEQRIYFVVSGIVRKFFYRGKEEVVSQLAESQHLISAASSFFTGEPSDYVVEALEPTTVLSITKQGLDFLYAQDYKFERLGRLVIIDWLVQKEVWESMRMQLPPKERFIRFAQSHPNLMQRVSQKYLASYLNIKPETFRRYKHLLTA
jgi:CRP-like cAMP-binding protein